MILTVVILAVLTLADRFLKVYLTDLLSEGNSVTLIRGIVGLRYHENTGAAFGIFSGKVGVLLIVTAVMITVVLYMLFFRSKNKQLQKVSLTLIAAGGLGNLYDRLFVGYVVDYIELLFMNYPLFNFADCMICVGAVLLCIAVIFFDKDTKEEIPA